ncbi:MAG: Na/Pi cotransporter family protein [Clostridia bacterium]|nr:Na/Pi cotransporter family protein [Clostridia bacterium]
MQVSDILGLFGGLALFLYGMQMMSGGLEAAAGNRMKEILEKLTSNRILGVLVGAVITAVIQSSSATTVMVVGFVNSGMMTLQQAVWIIMGANIGTTVTGLLISLDVGALAPLFAFIGVAMVVFLKSPKAHHIGNILAGLGVLFIGMDMMSAAMYPLRESEAFISLMTRFSNPVLGIAAGAVFTALIQSSSASIGILQALANGGLIGLKGSMFVLFGQNIGTCITAVLASVGTTRNAKRTTLIHLMFNLIGTTVFTALALVLPIADWIIALVPGAPAGQIAAMHIAFNVTTSLLLIPFGTYLAAAATKLLPDTAEPEVAETSLADLLEGDLYRGRSLFGSSAIQMDVLSHEIRRMLVLAGDNLDKSFRAIQGQGGKAELDEVNTVEETINGMNKEISRYIARILSFEKSDSAIAAIEEYFRVTGDAERIGDHAQNIAEYTQMIRDKKIEFSAEARSNIRQMQEVTGKMMQMLLSDPEDAAEWLSNIAGIEQQIDDMTETFRERQLQRMRQGLCSEEACVLYAELLTDFERVGDHALNIGQAFAKIAMAN